MRAAAISALLLSSICYASQVPLVPLDSSLSPAETISTPPHTATTTLVDLLSADGDYGQLLRLLQRTRLIPTLNKLNGSTLFAPTNDAVRRYTHFTDYLALPDPSNHISSNAYDNINERVRQQLLYHLLNYTLPTFPPEDSQIATYSTLHFPRIPISPPSKDPPPAPPWVPLPGGSLNNESQRLRAAVRGDSNGYTNEPTAYINVDAWGEGGTPIIKPAVQGTNCLLVGINDVLEVPPSLASIIRDTPSLSYLSTVLPESQMKSLENDPGLTVFLPEDDAWDQLHPVIKMYLESPFATGDLKWIVGMHVADGKLGYSDRFGDVRKIRTIEGNKLLINTTSPDGTTVSGADLRQKDVLASNGVLHTVSSLLLPENSLQLNAEKYLLALNCSTFVDLLRSVNLTALVTDPEGAYTILAPRDDVLDVEGMGGGGSFPDKGTEELKKSLRYHFIPGKWAPERLKDGALLETELIEVGLSGGRQVLDVGVSSKSSANAALGKGKGDKPHKELYFAGAGVIGDPIEIDNTLIYLVSRPLTPPTDVLTTALPSLSLSTYLAAVFSASLAETVKNLPRTTVLLPKNSAWEKLGLVTSYLLMPTSKKDLESVVLHHILNSIQYLSALQNGTERTFKTIEGTDVTVSRRAGGEDGDGESDGDNEDNEVEVVITGSGGWDGLHAKLALHSSGSDHSGLKPINTLTQTGVMHVIDTLMLPRSVDITLGKLVRAAGGGTMASLVVRAGMEWVLNGTAPPEDSEFGKRFGQGVGWTLLVPRDEAWRTVNLTKLWDDQDAVRSLVTQHLIPSVPPRKGGKKGGKKGGGKKGLDGKGVGTMMNADENSMPLDMYLSGESHVTARSAFSSYSQITFHDKGDHFIVGITDARGTSAEEDWARVLTWGRSTSSSTAANVVPNGSHGTAAWDGSARRGGVIKIDRVLVPYTPKWWVRYGPPVAGGIAGLVVLLGIGFTARWLYKRRESEPTYEPVGRDEEEDG